MSVPGTPQDLHPAEAAQRQRTNVVRLIRASFFVLTVVFTLLSLMRPGKDDLSQELALRWWVPLLFALALFSFAFAVDLLTPRKKIATITGVVVGVLVGMLATLAIWLVIDLVLKTWMDEKAIEALHPVLGSLKILLGITLSYLGVTTVIQTQDDFRLVIPYVEFAKQLRGTRALLVDSSVLIDGRIADIAATGFLQSPLIIPRSVVGELQLLADSAETMTRNKGRRGLDMIARLQRSPKIDLTIDDRPVQAKAVDQTLVELAQSMGAHILTTDTGLAKVAAIHSIGVLNINELANALKLSLVPGEQISLKLLRQGEQAGQAVGFLADGTMIVVEDGMPRIGETTLVTVTSSMQTSAGRLIFARLADPPPMAPPPAPAEQPADAAGSGAPIDSSGSGVPIASAPGRSPFPPKPPASIRASSPRNPRR